MNRNHRNHRKDFNNEEKKYTSVEEAELPKIHEPRPICSMCNEPIESIAEAISENNGSYSHFDCVLNKLREMYHVEEPDKISYIGTGNFAVFTKNEDGQFVIKEKINYESLDSFNSMKKMVEGSRNE